MLGAAELLHEDGIEARVVKLNRISPFRGGELSEIIGTTKRLLVAEECAGVGCIGQRIAAILAEEGTSPRGSCSATSGADSSSREASASCTANADWTRRACAHGSGGAANEYKGTIGRRAR